jgi:hypothetical protein
MQQQWIWRRTIIPVVTAMVATTAVTALTLDAGTQRADANGPCPTFFVATDGDDANKGTEDEPWKTVEHARDHIRDNGLNQGPRMICDITVNVKAGEYPVSQTIAFDDRDSGANGHQVVYRSVDGPGKANFVGAEEITGWQPYKDGIYKAKVDPKKPFYTIFEDGKRSTMARYPNRRNDEVWAPYLMSRLGEPEKEAVHQWLYWEPGDWDPAWDDTPTSNPLKNAQLTVWSGGSWSWFTDIVPIGGADYRKGFTTLNFWTRYALVNSRSGSRYFIQNAMEFLDQPGEYYFDYGAGDLYYKPRGSIDDVKVMRPTVKTTFSLAGASPQRRLHDITFDGLGVQYTDFMNWYRAGWISAGDSGQVHKYAEYDRQIEMPRHRYGAITLTNTRNVELTGMHLQDTGYHGIYMLFHNDHVTVKDSLLENLGADGIKVEGGYPGEGDIANHNTFSNLYIHHIGELVPGDSAGLELMNTSNNQISNIVVKHSARYGISLEARPEVKDGDGYAVNNTFKYIRLEETGLDSGDMGAFYTYGVDNQEPHPVQNTVEQVVITDVIPDASMPDSGTRGIHMDAGGCGFSFANIEVGKVTDDKYQSYHCNQVTNANWAAGFDPTKMEYDKIGVLPTFPYDVPQG